MEESEPEKPRISRHADRIKMKLADESSLANIVSIQPIFHDDGVINESYIFFLYRQVKKNKLKYCCETRLRKGEENNIIHEKLVPFSQLNETIYKEIHDNARHFYLNGRLYYWFKRKGRIIDELHTVSCMMKCSNTAFRGRAVVISDEVAISRVNFTTWHYKNFDFLYTDKTVPDNMAILASTGDTNFDRPIVACPLLNRKKFEEFCAARNYNIENIPVETNNMYPVSQRFYKIYKIYEEFINESTPQWWYVENLGGKMTQNYFTTIRFLRPTTKRGFERRRRYIRRKIAERIVLRRRKERLEQQNS